MPEVKPVVNETTGKYMVMAGDAVVASNIDTQQEADRMAECIRCKMEVS